MILVLLKNTAMEIVKAFQNNELSMHITIQGTYEEPLFRASDVGEILEMTNIRVIMKDFDSTEKVVHTIKTKGGPQQVTFLTEKGLKKLICKSRKPSAIDLAKQLGINMVDIFYIPLETSLVHFLQECYPDETMIHQFSVDPYKIDLYFPNYKLAIECDEYIHIFKQEDDLKRENYIKEKLNCQFIRFKQDKKNKNLSKLINQINQVIYNDQIKDNIIIQLKLENEKLKKDKKLKKLKNDLNNLIDEYSKSL